jgi:E3 ubiquitin-protein ligase HECTD2
MTNSLSDLSQYKPRLARGLRQLLDFEGDVESTFLRTFVVEVERYGSRYEVPLCKDGERKPVTSKNRREYVDLYVRYVLDTAVARQFEPFKRGFYQVCSGSAFGLFRPEEVELLVRGSDEPLDVATLRGVAVYDEWGTRNPDCESEQVVWFWELFIDAVPQNQRKLLSFITGSDRVPAAGASMMPLTITCLGDDADRLPVARTCFNRLSLWRYASKEKMSRLLWLAVHESEGFGLQ